MAEALSSILPVPVNPWGGDWLEQYFPEDLPPEWRVDYYFNEFNVAVLTPARFKEMADESRDALVQSLNQGGRVISDEGWEYAGFSTNHCLCSLRSAPVPWCVAASQGQSAWQCGEERIEYYAPPKDITPRDLREDVEAFVARCRGKNGVWLVESTYAGFNRLRTLLQLMGLY